MMQRGRGRAALSILLVLGLAACTTRTAPITYSGSAPISTASAPRAGVAEVGVGEVIDARGESDPNWVGAIRGGFGQPVKTVRSEQPVADVVRQAFIDALAAHGLLARSQAPRYLLRVIVRQFATTQYARRESNMNWQVALEEPVTGRRLYADTIEVTLIEGSAFSLQTGVFGSTDALLDLGTRAMSQAIDQVLNDPAFAAAIAPLS
jgi:hypothetical protein